MTKPLDLTKPLQFRTWPSQPVEYKFTFKDYYGQKTKHVFLSTFENGLQRTHVRYQNGCLLESKIDGSDIINSPEEKWGILVTVHNGYGTKEFIYGNIFQTKQQAEDFGKAQYRERFIKAFQIKDND